MLSPVTSSSLHKRGCLASQCRNTVAANAHRVCKNGRCTSGETFSSSPLALGPLVADDALPLLPSACNKSYRSSGGKCVLKTCTASECNQAIPANSHRICNLNTQTCAFGESISSCTSQAFLLYPSNPANFVDTRSLQLWIPVERQRLRRRRLVVQGEQLPELDPSQLPTHLQGRRVQLWCVVRSSFLPGSPSSARPKLPLTSCIAGCNLGFHREGDLCKVDATTCTASSQCTRHLPVNGLKICRKGLCGFSASFSASFAHVGRELTCGGYSVQERLQDQR